LQRREAQCDFNAACDRIRALEEAVAGLQEQMAEVLRLVGPQRLEKPKPPQPPQPE
jgi:hypothetical protein